MYLQVSSGAQVIFQPLSSASRDYFMVPKIQQRQFFMRHQMAVSRRLATIQSPTKTTKSLHTTTSVVPLVSVLVNVRIHKAALIELHRKAPELFHADPLTARSKRLENLGV